MIVQELDLLAEKANAYTAAFLDSLRTEQEVGVINGFITQFYSVTAQPIAITSAVLTDIQQEIHRHDLLVNYVFGLRFFTLAYFTRKETALIAECFANANANRPMSDNLSNKSTLPDDAVAWKVKVNDLIELYEANTWLLPLLALGLSYPNFIDQAERVEPV